MKKKVVSIMMTAALAVGMLAGCGNSDSGSSNAASGNDSKSTSEAGSTSASASNAAEEEEITTTLTVWSPSEDQASDSGEWLQTMCNQFAEEHPSWHITFDYIPYPLTAISTVYHSPQTPGLCTMINLHSLRMK